MPTETLATFQTNQNNQFYNLYVVQQASPANSGEAPSCYSAARSLHQAGSTTVDVEATVRASVGQSSLRAHIPELLRFVKAQAPKFSWAEPGSSASISGGEFSSRIDTAYEALLSWRRNLFQLPSGKAGKSFVAEQARLFEAFAAGSVLESVALKAALVMPALLLQKPSSTSKAKDHTAALAC